MDLRVGLILEDRAGGDQHERAVAVGPPFAIRGPVGVVELGADEVHVVRDVRPAARVRIIAIIAITASTSQAALAVNTPDGGCASAEFFRAAAVKNAWKRHTSKSVSWPAAVCASALKSGIRRTTSRPGT